MDVILSFVVALLVAAVVIFIVGRLNLGLTVDSYGSAIIAALVIAIVAAVVAGFSVYWEFRWGEGSWVRSYC